MSTEFTWNESERDYWESWSSRRAIFSIPLDFEKKTVIFSDDSQWNRQNYKNRAQIGIHNLILNCNVILWHAKQLLLNVNFPLTGIHWIITARTIVYNLESAQNPFTRRVFLCLFYQNTASFFERYRRVMVGQKM